MRRFLPKAMKYQVMMYSKGSSVCVRAHFCECPRAYMRVCVCLCVHSCVCVCVCVFECACVQVYVDGWMDAGVLMGVSW